MARSRRGFGAAACALAALACGGEGLRSKPVASEPSPAALGALSPGQSVGGRLAVGGTASLSVELAEDEYIEVVLRSRADLALAAREPSGSRVLRVDTPSTKVVPEKLVLHARQAGAYRLEVDGGRRDAEGPFELEWTVRRPASPADRRRAEAERLLAQGEEERRTSRRCTERPRCEAALPHYRFAVETFLRLGEEERERFALTRLGAVLVDLGRPAEALPALARRLELLPAAAEPEERAIALQQVGDIRSRLGETADGERLSREALELWRDLGNTKRIAEVQTDLARMALHDGRLGEAERLYREAVEVWRNQGQPSDEAIGLANLSGVYLLAGDRQLALDHCDEALAKLSAEDSAEDRAFVLEQRAAALGGLGRTAEAEQSYREALALRETSSAPGAKANALAGLARQAYERGEWDRAAELYSLALAESRARQDLTGEVTVLQDLAWTEEKRGEVAASRARFEEALTLSRRHQLRRAEAAMLLGLAKLERNQSRLSEALAWMEQAIASLETLRTGSERLELRSAVGADNQTFYDVAVDLALRQAESGKSRDEEKRAFGWADQARGRRLLDLLEAKSQCGDHEARLRVERAERSVRALEAEGAGPAALALARRELRAALALLQQPAAVEGGPSFAEARSVDLAVLQRHLAASDAVLLAYTLGEERSVAWVVTPSSFSSRRLERPAELEGKVRELHGLLSTSAWRAQNVRADELIAELSRELLPPNLEVLAARRLLIVPDGVLHVLPFAVLETGTPATPLGATHELAYVLSASAAVRLAKPRTAREFPFELALLADPVFGAADSRLSRGQETPSGATASRRDWSADRELLRLGGAEREAQAISQRVAPARLLEATGFAATKGRLLSPEVRSARLLHLAVHGVLNEEHPELSAVVLSQRDESGSSIDGTLYAHELPCHPLAAELVVLSACDSGLGARVEGEGLVGLAHGFFGAGARRVLASLWKVDDAATAVLMDAFYEGLMTQGLPPAAALLRAQEKLRQKPGFESPFFWAGFVLLGGH